MKRRKRELMRRTFGYRWNSPLVVFVDAERNIVPRRYAFRAVAIALPAKDGKPVCGLDEDRERLKPKPEPIDWDQPPPA